MGDDYADEDALEGDEEGENSSQDKGSPMKPFDHEVALNGAATSSNK
jgi:hypothetical protein